MPVGVIEFLLGALIILVVFGGLGAIAYLFVFNRRTRQSLHDLAVGSFVVRGSPAVVPVGLSTPRLHLIVVGCCLTLLLIGPGIVWALWGSSFTTAVQPLAELQAALKVRHGIRGVEIKVRHSTTATVRTGTSTTTYLQVVARSAEGRENLDALSLAMAGTVFDLHPDLLGNQMLIVSVRRGFDLGIASWSEIHQVALDAAAWRKKLAHPRADPKQT